ncbi:MAG TPA: electron transfer flavoprotein subunit alpha/FixB family protein, partial [Geobacteraceae bacterium]|nr:electron transfer flavoprotein subunit alpha/FixB family protein [Geobacteraceae bacterium]
MKALLVCEYREGKLLDASYELIAFADRLGADKVLVVIGGEGALPRFNGQVYLADAGKYGEYNPDLHKKLVLAAVDKENPDCIVFVHSSYGWDLAPRVAAALKAAQVSEVVAVADGNYEVTCCNGKMRRTITPATARTVVTIQAGAFTASPAEGTPQVTMLDLADTVSPVEFLGYEAADAKGVDLAKAEVIVSAGRGVGKKENVPLIAALAKAL